jgi:glucose/arabinose dehydrogenase
VLVLFAAGLACSRPRLPDLPLGEVRLPPGFRIALYARVPGARSLALGKEGTVFVGTRERGGSVFAITDKDRDGKGEEVFTLGRGLMMPNGVAFRDGALYVAEVGRVIRFDGIESRLADPPEPMVVTQDLPGDVHHGWKFIAFGPDGQLYVPVGAPCNICLREDPRYASLLRLGSDGRFEVHASGIRNTVGFDWHPASGELWFTDNGRDMMGDDVPPDELNRAPRAALHFGYPFCHGGDIPDPELGQGKKCSDYVPPARKLGAHVAALGLRFYRGTHFPEAYRGQIFVAEHGSWNRSQPSGYRLMVARLSGQDVVSYEVFAEGFLRGAKAWGRPVDVMEMPDGALLVSDDEAGAVYRITYGG